MICLNAAGASEPQALGCIGDTSQKQMSVDPTCIMNGFNYLNAALSFGILCVFVGKCHSGALKTFHIRINFSYFFSKVSHDQNQPLLVIPHNVFKHQDIQTIDVPSMNEKGGKMCVLLLLLIIIWFLTHIKETFE